VIEIVLLILLAAILALAVVLLGTMFYAAFISSPYAATSQPHIRKALELCSLKPGEKFYDLGSGDGRALIIASKEFLGEAVGFELSLYHFLLSKIKIRLSSCPDRIKVKWSDFYREDLGDADVIFCWLTSRAFPKLAAKFNAELKPGTRIAAFSSPLVFWEPIQIVKLPLLKTTLFDKLLAKLSPEEHSRLYLYIKK
jgi:hypothetical protein